MKVLRLKDLLSEFNTTTVGNGGGIAHGDSWPDGIFTRYGERRIIGPAAMPRGMKQIVAPASDAVYGGDGSKIPKTAMERDGNN